MTDEMIEKIATLAEGRKGESPEKIPQETNSSSAIQEAIKVRDELTQLRKGLQEDRAALEKLASDLMIGGRAFAGQPQKEKTKEEIEREKADALVKRFLGK